jgi:hypothetical protein
MLVRDAGQPRPVNSPRTGSVVGQGSGSGGAAGAPGLLHERGGNARGR